MRTVIIKRKHAKKPFQVLFQNGSPKTAPCVLEKATRGRNPGVKGQELEENGIK